MKVDVKTTRNTNRSHDCNKFHILKLDLDKSVPAIFEGEDKKFRLTPGARRVLQF
jgi:hypothetical protein